MSRHTVAVAAWTCCLLVIGSLALSTAWDRWTVAVVLSVAAALPLLLLRLVVRLGAGPWTATSVIVLLLVLGAYALAAEAGTTFAQTVRDAVPRLLTSPRPYPARPDLLVAPLLLTALVSLLVGLRASSAHRVAPVVGAAVLYVAGSLLTSGGADPWGLLAAILLVVALLGWALLDEHRMPAVERIGTVAPVAATGVLVVAVATLVPSTTPFEPRRAVDPPVVEVVASSPMPTLGAWALHPDRELLRVSGPEVPLRLVTLDRYDGSTWTAATRYTAFGSAPIDPALPAGSDQRSLRHTVRLTGLGGSWLPSAGQPSAASAPSVRVDPGTGTLFAADAGEEFEYSVTSVVDVAPPDRLEAARVRRGGSVSRFLELPPLPDELVALARQAGDTATTPYSRAEAIEDLVRDGAQLSAKAISGSQLWRIKNFVAGGPGDPGALVGTSEQFATTFALLARANGLPTRVVVGFMPGETQDDGSRVVRGEHAFAWPEVYFEGLGWVPFSPTPEHDTFRRDRTYEARADDGAKLPASAGTPPGDAGTRHDPEAPRTTWRAAVELVVLWPWLLAGGGVAVLLSLAGARWARRRIHLRRGATGAWAEVLDALHLSGHRPAPHQTATDVAAATDRRWHLDVTGLLAVDAEHAAFGPDGPRAHSHDALRAVRRAARRSLPWWRRWWWPFDPRVLGR